MEISLFPIPQATGKLPLLLLNSLSCERLEHIQRTDTYQTEPRNQHHHGLKHAQEKEKEHLTANAELQTEQLCRCSQAHYQMGYGIW